MVQALGDQFLARATIADHQHRPVERRCPARALDCVEKGQALPDELIDPFHAPTVGAKSHALARYFISFGHGFSRFFDFSRQTRKMARLLNSNQPKRTELPSLEAK